jgi:hypothetical protein
MTVIWKELSGGCRLARLPVGRRRTPPSSARRKHQKNLAEPPNSATSLIMPFGKYRGCLLADIVADANYTNWLLAQPWFAEKFPEHQSYIEAMRNFDTGPSAA